MITKYQLIILGSNNLFTKQIIEITYQHLNELGIDSNFTLIIDESNFETAYRSNAPTFCLYFGGEINFSHLDILSILQRDATLILPVVSDLNKFNQQIPEVLRNINGFELSSVDEIEKLVSCILEGLGLLRIARRLFISYKRDESSAIAIQLFEQFEKCGFDVFLDTHSIRKGDSFQEELWHRMADTDIVVLLNTPGFLKSQWTSQELAQANAMSIGILQLIWPNHKLERDAEICLPIQLKKRDFRCKMFNYSNPTLVTSKVKEIIRLAESLRARSLAARQDNIVSEFVGSANRVNKKVHLQYQRFISVKNSKGENLAVIPTVGIPQAFTYEQSSELIAQIESNDIVGTYLLYDQTNIRNRWIKHLDWLNEHLPIKAIKIIESEKWLRDI